MNRVKTAIAMVAVVAVLIGSLAVISVQDTEAEYDDGYEAVRNSFDESKAVYLAPNGGAPSGVQTYTNFVDAYKAVADHGVIYFCGDYSDPNLYSTNSDGSQNGVTYLDGKSVLITSYGDSKAKWSFSKTISSSHSAFAYYGDGTSVLMIENISIDISGTGASSGIASRDNAVVWIGNGTSILSENVGVTAANTSTLNISEGSEIDATNKGIWNLGGTVNYYGGTISVSNSNSQGIYVNSGIVNMYGGTIDSTDVPSNSGSNGVYVAGGTFKMFGGSIEHNNSYGITPAGGTTQLNGGSITGTSGWGVNFNNVSNGTVAVGMAEAEEPLIIRDTNGSAAFHMASGKIIQYGGMCADGSDVYLAPSAPTSTADVQIVTSDSTVPNYVDIFRADNGTVVYSDGTYAYDRYGTVYTFNNSGERPAGSLWMSVNLTEVDPEAMIGSKEFVTLESAVEYAMSNPGDDEIIVLKDVVIETSLQVSGADGSIIIRSDGGQVYTVSGTSIGTMLNVVNSTVTLRDITFDGSVDGKNTNLPVNLGSGAYFTLDSGATVQNGAGSIFSYVSSGNPKASITLKEGCVVSGSTNRSGNVGGSYYVVSGILVAGNVDFLMTGGTIEDNYNSGGAGVLSFNNNNSNTSLITGGLITGNNRVFYLGNAHLQIAGGEITNNTGTHIFGGPSPTVIIGNGGVSPDIEVEKKLIIRDNNTSDSGDIDIISGSSRSYTLYGDASYYSDGLDLRFYSGEFITDPTTDQVLASVVQGSEAMVGYISSNTADATIVLDDSDGNSYIYQGGTRINIEPRHEYRSGTIWVSQKYEFSTDTAVARIGDSYFTTLQAAADAVEPGETIYLLTSVSENVTFWDKDGVTLRSESAGDRKVITGDFRVVSAEVTLHDVILGSAYDSNIVKNMHISASSLDKDNVGVLTIGSGTTISNIYNNGISGERGHNVLGFNIFVNEAGVEDSIQYGTINIEEGALLENLVSNYGAIRVTNGSTMNINGGTITNCYSTSNEGTVIYVSSHWSTGWHSTLNINGGEIIGNGRENGSAPGTIYLHQNGGSILNITGGRITDNTATRGGAVYDASTTGSNGLGPNTITVSGNPYIGGNTGTAMTSDTKESNIYLQSGKTITVNGRLTDGAYIGVYSTITTDEGIIATGAVYEDLQYFYSDFQSEHGVVFDDGTMYKSKEGISYALGHSPAQQGSIWLAKVAAGDEPVERKVVVYDADGQILAGFVTINDAVTYFEADKSAVGIRLLTNIEQDGSVLIDYDDGRAMTFDGQGNTVNWKTDADDLFTIDKAGTNVTFKNITLDGKGGSKNAILVTGYADVILEEGTTIQNGGSGVWVIGISGSAHNSSTSTGFRMESGALITGNSGFSRNIPEYDRTFNVGGIASIGPAQIFNIFGGEVSSNTGVDAGGLLFANNDGNNNIIWNLDIIGNKATGHVSAGGIMLWGDAVMQIASGMVTDNVGGGIYSSPRETPVSGDRQRIILGNGNQFPSYLETLIIDDNTLNGVETNVRLNTGITIDFRGTLLPGSHIGVWTDEVPDESTDIRIGKLDWQGITPDLATVNHFFSDRGDYGTVFDSGGKSYAKGPTDLTDEIHHVQKDNTLWLSAAAKGLDTAVAEVDGKRYNTLEEAIEAAGDGQTITIIQNIQLDAGVTISGKDVTIDLNGNTISNANSTNTDIITVDTKWSLTIKDSVGTGSITSVGTGSAIVNNGSLTVEGGSIVGSGSAVVNNGNAEFDGGSVTGPVSNNGSIGIDGGDFTAPETTFTGNNILAFGGKFNDTNKGQVGMVDGYEMADKGDYWTPESSGTLKVGDRVFSKLQDAVDEALRTGLPIEVTGDTTITSGAEVSGDIEINGNGHTITYIGDGPFMTVGEDADVSLGGVIVDGNDQERDTAGFVVNGGSITFGDGTTVQNFRNPNDNGGAVSANGGQVTVDGATFTGNSASNGGAISVTGGAEVTVTDGEITGNTATVSGGAIFVDGGTADIDGGSIYNNTGDVGNGVSAAGDSKIEIDGTATGITDSFGIMDNGPVIDVTSDRMDSTISVEFDDSFFEPPTGSDEPVLPDKNFVTSDKMTDDALKEDFRVVNPGYTFSPEGDGLKLVASTDIVAVIENDDGTYTQFYSVQAAIDAAKETDTVYLVSHVNQGSVSSDDPVITESTITIPNGKNITLSSIERVVNPDDSSDFSYNKDCDNVILQRGPSFLEEMISVENGGSLTLDGVTIDGGADWEGGSIRIEDDGKGTPGSVTTNATGVTAHAPAIVNKGTLVMGDGSVIQNNCNNYAVPGIGFGSQYYGGAIRNEGSGQFTMKDGATIQDCYAREGGAVMNIGRDTASGAESPTVIIEGGTIEGNMSQQKGAAIQTIYGGATTEIKGGSITGNDSLNNLGIVSVEEGGIVSISGGSINAPDGDNAVYVYNQYGQIDYDQATVKPYIEGESAPQVSISGSPSIDGIHLDAASDVYGKDKVYEPYVNMGGYSGDPINIELEEGFEVGKTVATNTSVDKLVYVNESDMYNHTELIQDGSDVILGGYKVVITQDELGVIDITVGAEGIEVPTIVIDGNQIEFDEDGHATITGNGNKINIQVGDDEDTLDYVYLDQNGNVSAVGDVSYVDGQNNRVPVALDGTSPADIPVDEHGNAIFVIDGREQLVDITMPALKGHADKLIDEIEEALKDYGTSDTTGIRDLVDDFIGGLTDGTFDEKLDRIEDLVDKIMAEHIASGFDGSTPNLDNIVERDWPILSDDGKVEVTVDEEGGFIVTVKDDITGGVDISGSVGDITIDLGGNEIKAPAGEPAIEIINNNGDVATGTDLTIAGPGNVTGADGNTDGGSGTPAISVTGPNASITVDKDAQVSGGNGADSTSGKGGDGAPGITGDVDVTVAGGGDVTGGTGGDSKGPSGNGGTGGDGIENSGTVTVKDESTVTGGDGGNGSGTNGTGGTGGNGVTTDGDTTVTGSSEVTGGTGGDGGSTDADGETGGTGGTGGTGIDNGDSKLDIDDSTVTGGTGGTGGSAPNGYGGTGGDGGAGVDGDGETSIVGSTEVIGGTGGTGGSGDPMGPGFTGGTGGTGGDAVDEGTSGSASAGDDTTIAGGNGGNGGSIGGNGGQGGNPGRVEGGDQSSGEDGDKSVGDLIDRIEDAFGDNDEVDKVDVVYNEETGQYEVTVKDDITGPVIIPDIVGDIVIDLGGNTITGDPENEDTGSAIVVVDEGGDKVDITITGPGSVTGADGAENTGESGSPAITVEDTDTSITVDEGAQVSGGNGADNPKGDGGNGGAGITGDVDVTVTGSGSEVSGGDGGNATGDTGNGGNGGDGVENTGTTNVNGGGAATGGDGGSSAGDNGGAGGAGADTEGDVTVSGSDSEVSGGAGGSSQNGDGGDGGAGIDSTGNAVVEDNGTSTGGAGGSSQNGDGGNGGSGTIAGEGATVNGGTSTGGNGGAGAAVGGDGGDGIHSNGTAGVDNGGTVTGGNGGNGGSQGGNGGDGIDSNGNTTVSGGNDPEGSTVSGGAGGDSDTGTGGSGGTGIDNGGSDLTINGSNITGGDGGNGGDNTGTGGNGGDGGHGGSAVDGEGDTDINGNSHITGGNGGHGGAGDKMDTDSSGGNGGHGGNAVNDGSGNAEAEDGSTITGGNGGNGGSIGGNGGQGGTSENVTGGTQNPGDAGQDSLGDRCEQIEKAFEKNGGDVEVTYDPEQGYVVTVVENVPGPVTIPDTWGDVTVELGGHSIGNRTDSAIIFTDSENGKGTNLVINGPGFVTGGTNSEGNGTPAIDASGNKDSTITVGPNANVIGGNGASNSPRAAHPVTEATEPPVSRTPDPWTS